MKTCLQSKIYIVHAYINLRKNSASFMGTGIACAYEIPEQINSRGCPPPCRKP